MHKIPIPLKTNMYDVISKFINKFNILAIPHINNNLANIIKTGKDHIKKSDNPNAVYKLSCNKCNAQYVGEAKSALKFRMQDHETSIRNKPNAPVALHCTATHNIN